MRRRFTAYLRSATLKAEATLEHLKSGGPAFLRDDDEFAPDLCFLALNERQDVVGVAQCWTGAFIKDLVVHPLARRRGIATALLRRVFWEFRRRGVKHVDLKVQLDNPTGAVRLYKELGMREIALDGS